jgi:8-amino-7-oxononanoate synthase
MPFTWLNDELQRLEREGLRRRPREVVPLGHGWCEVDGRRVRNFASNDYLGLAADPRVIAGAAHALMTFGGGAGASPLVTGRTAAHVELERKLAEFEGAPAALLFPSGFAANSGTIAALAGPGDAVYCDRLNHASLIDGCRLSRARFRVYPHVDCKSLEKLLAKDQDARRKLIVTDSVFSMDGDAAPLDRLCDLAERHGAMLLIDEAHATGIFGQHGRGQAEEQGIERRPPVVRVGTLSKALGAQGGFVTGSPDLIDWLFNAARPQMFSTALSPGACGAACASLEIVQREPERRSRLSEASKRLREELRTAAIDVPESACGPIIPVIIGDNARTLELAAALEERGHLVGAIRPPTVPQGTSRLRISLSAAHSQEDFDRLAADLVDLLSGSRRTRAS